MGFTGDGDGDGADDLVVFSEPTAGVATGYRYSGATLLTLPPTPMQSAATTLTDAEGTPQGVFPAGDTDGDGLDDFWVASPFRLVPGSAAGVLDLGTSAVTIRVVGEGVRVLVASTDDVDGDGNRDLLVSSGKAVHLFRGPFAPGEYDASDAALTILADPDDDLQGTAFSADLDGDGVTEIVVGVDPHAWESSGADVNLAGIPATTTGTVQLSDREAMSWWVPFSAGLRRAARAGDVNGDGQVDLIVADQGWSVVPGPLLGEVDPAGSAIITFDPQPGVAFGAAGNRNWAIGTLGDLDGDGLSEIYSLQSGPVEGDDQRPDGALYVVRGSRRGIVEASSADAVWVGDVSDDSTSAVIRTDGDADGDGLNDVLLSMLWSPRSPHAGHVYWLPGASLLSQP